jgi:hypothetical protein
MKGQKVVRTFNSFGVNRNYKGCSTEDVAYAFDFLYSSNASRKRSISCFDK